MIKIKIPNYELMEYNDEYYLEQLLQMYEISTAVGNREFPDVGKIMRWVASNNLNRHYTKEQLKILAENYSELGALTYDGKEDFFFSSLNPMMIRKLLKILREAKKEEDNKEIDRKIQ